MTVTRSQQNLLTDLDTDRARTAPELIKLVESYLGKSIRVSLEGRWSFVDHDSEEDAEEGEAERKEIELTSVRRAANYFSAEDVRRLLDLILDKAAKRAFERQFDRAELRRRAGKQLGTTSGLNFDITSRDLLNKVGLGHSERAGGEANYWTIKLFALQLSFGNEPKVATCENLRGLYEKYVAPVRIEEGEVPAFRNAIVLMYAYLCTRPFGTREQRHALLGISYIAIDLAAQVNDYKSLWKLADRLEADAEHFGPEYGAERALLNRLIFDARARAYRYSPKFDNDYYEVRNAIDRLAHDAIKPAGWVLETMGDLAFVWPELTAAWVGSYFGLLNFGINVGWSPERLSDMFKCHDELVMAIKPISPGATLLTETVKQTSTGDPYAAEFIATLALSRENPRHSLLPRKQNYKRAFDPDKALTLIRDALNNTDPNTHYGDSIVGALQLARAEAILCKGGHEMTMSMRDEYEVVRREAAQTFDRLGMKRKMLRLNHLELRAGILARITPTTVR
jgi:hypothetical protein